MALYQLDTFQFVNAMTEGGGSPPRSRTKLIPLIRPGVEGTAFLIDALRGEPFRMTTFVDVVNDAAAVNLMKNYEATIGAGRFNLIWKGIDYASDYLTDFVVLDVRNLGHKFFPVSAGGLSGTSACIGVRCEWTLVPLKVVTP